MKTTRRNLLQRCVPQVPGPPPPPPLPPILRPPGALEELAFAKACDHCGECQRACPHNAIVGLPDEYGLAAGTPAVDALDQPCRVCPDMPCAAACPTPALSVTPWSAVRMGAIDIVPEHCWVEQGQRCDYCVTACPLEDSAIEITVAGVMLDEDRCVGCGACVYYCTAFPRALAVRPLPLPKPLPKTADSR